MSNQPNPPNPLAKESDDTIESIEMKSTEEVGTFLSNNEVECSDMKITDVIEDVLEHVMGFLNVCDVVNFSKSCDRFNHLTATSRFKRKFKHFHSQMLTNRNSLDMVTIQQYKAVMKEIGENIAVVGMVDLRIFQEPQYTMPFLVKYCPNIKSIQMHGSTRFTDLDGLPAHLQELNIIMFQITDDNLSMYLRASVSTLNLLSLTNISKLHGHFLNELLFLTSLTINSCHELEIPLLYNYLNKKPPLTVLSITLCPVLDNSIFKIILTNLPLLTSCIIDYYGFFPGQQKFDLPQLKTFFTNFEFIRKYSITFYLKNININPYLYFSYEFDMDNQVVANVVAAAAAN